MGMAWLVYPGAEHSRFSHALGAFHVAQQFLKNQLYRNILILNAEFNHEYHNWAIRDADELAFRFAQLTIGESATATILTNEDTGVDEMALHANAVAQNGAAAPASFCTTCGGRAEGTWSRGPISGRPGSRSGRSGRSDRSGRGASRSRRRR